MTYVISVQEYLQRLIVALTAVADKTKVEVGPKEVMNMIMAMATDAIHIDAMWIEDIKWFSLDSAMKECYPFWQGCLTDYEADSDLLTMDVYNAISEIEDDVHAAVHALIGREGWDMYHVEKIDDDSISVVKDGSFLETLLIAEGVDLGQEKKNGGSRSSGKHWAFNRAGLFRERFGR